MQKKISKIIIAIISTLFLMPIISAYSYSGFSGFGNFGYYGSPLDLFQNEWIMFAIVFAVFFATIFYTLYKVLKNKGVAAVVSGGISILITIAIVERGLIQAYGGGELSSWALFLAAVIGIAFLIRFASESFGKIGAVIIVFLIWLVLYNFYPGDLLPTLLNNIPAFVWFYGFLTSWIGLIILLVLTIAFAGNRGWTGWPGSPGRGAGRAPAWRDAWG